MIRNILIAGVLIGFSFLLITGCAPMTGTSKLIYQSLPHRPRWIGTIPQSRVYEYFVGISDNKNTLEEAKKAAISDALNDALSKRGIEVTARYEKMATEEKYQLLDQVSIGGTARIGLAQVTWYHEEWEYYHGRTVAKKYRAFVLMRTKKLRQDSIIRGVLINIGERVDACWHSMLIPGWGQFRYEKRGKGRLFLLTELGAVAGFGFFHYQHERAKDDYLKLELDYKDAAEGSSEKRKLAHDLAVKKDEHEDIKRYRTYFTYAAFGIYAVNLVDALLFGPPSQDKFTKLMLNERLFLATRMRAGVPIIYLCIKL